MYILPYLEYCLFLDARLTRTGGNDHLRHIKEAGLGLTLFAVVLVDTQLPNQLAIKITIKTCIIVRGLGLNNLPVKGAEGASIDQPFTLAPGAEALATSRVRV